MKTMNERLSPEEVEGWLAENHPELSEAATYDRNWLWLAGVNLQGDQHKQVREELKEKGFRFAHANHDLPSGDIARWYVWFKVPPKFRRTRKSTGQKTTEDADAALLAALTK